MSIEVRRAADRFTTVAEGIRTRHSFSFGTHYDPANVGHALLVAHNDDRVEPGAGYGTHPHRDLEIVTWVLDGALRHEDSHGEGGLVVPDVMQRLSAGRGVRHSEVNDAATGASVRFVQMWVRPDEPGGDPGYAQRDVAGALAGSELVPVVSGLAHHRDGGAVPLGSSGAGLLVARLGPAGEVTLPDAPYVHLFVTRGSVALEAAGLLEEGDAARLTAAGPRRVTAGAAGGEVLVWEMWP